MYRYARTLLRTAFDAHYLVFVIVCAGVQIRCQLLRDLPQIPVLEVDGESRSLCVKILLFLLLLHWGVRVRETGNEQHSTVDSGGISC